MGVRKWLEKSAEKQKHKLRKTLNPLSRKAFQAVSFSATKDKTRQNRTILTGFSSLWAEL
jgi:TATA-binding protein-associated factor Taf7